MMLFFVWILSVIPAASLALSSETYGLWVGPVQVTDDNRLDIAAAINAVEPNAASGTASFDPSTNTLTLESFAYAGAGYAFASNKAAAIYSDLNHLTVETRAAGSVVCKADGNEVYGICAEHGLTASGGSLTASAAGNAAAKNIGIYIGRGYLTVASGTLVGQSGRAVNISQGIWCFDGDILVEKDAMLQGSGASANITRGICVSNALTVNGGSVKGLADSADSICHGISAGSIGSTQSTSVINCAAGQANESAGIRIWNESTFDQGILCGISEGRAGYGIYADGLTVGSDVIASGKSGAFRSSPTVKKGFVGAGAWYGDNEAAANDMDPIAANTLGENYKKPYVRIAYANIPATGDSAMPLLCACIALLALIGLIRKRKTA